MGSTLNAETEPRKSFATVKNICAGISIFPVRPAGFGIGRQCVGIGVGIVGGGLCYPERDGLTAGAADVAAMKFPVGVEIDALSAVRGGVCDDGINHSQQKKTGC